jgi:hypothetical protein
MAFAFPHIASANESTCDLGTLTSCWYVGVGGAVSRLDPEGEVNGWSTNDTSSSGFEVHVGQQFSENWHWEFKYLDAGDAGLGNRNPAIEADVPDAAISYKIPSLMVGYTFWKGGLGSSVYGKAGISNIKTKSNDRRIGQDSQTSTQLAFGVGYQYEFAESLWFMNVEFESYDRDAHVFGVSLSRRFN